MHRLVSLFAVSFAIFVACTDSKSSAADTTGIPAVRAAVESTTTAFHQALRTNDTTSFYSFIDDDVIMMPPGEAEVRGIAKLRSWYSAFLGQYQTSSLNLKDKEVVVGDGWASEVGSYDWGLKPTKGGAEIVDHGHYMQIWKRAPDGKWKFYREIWNSATPPA